MWEKGEKIFFFHFFILILLKINTNYAHMQHFIQIPEKMKTGVQNLFKWEMGTLPFNINTRNCLFTSEAIKVIS